ncbi:Wzz/FepE/Etk N-terminal domain-containing protein [Runella sp. SP2]|uniref:Wzz/FepE/Etk N-terminal domain-containing protein n=1 Tax=Runella sp. SP2 TaxID=2268026 RepID=UPI000F09340B|nr:Wzz/FepE/Etk N-terminal domain-containing protein [Runella sp. SP2]AYQ30784.1 lipopolysaccharide biosynthesis protein [Runella sp. SP2]
MKEEGYLDEHEPKAFINLGKLWAVIWKEKWIIMLLGLLATFCGGYYAFSIQEEFESQGKILPEIPPSASGSLGSLAGALGLSGIDLKNATEAIRPDLYPEVLKSTTFYLDLMKQPVVTRTNQKLTFEEFYHRVVEENEEIDTTLLKKFNVEAKGFYVLNRINENRIKDLRKRIFSTYDRKAGVISISVKLPDPVVAATVAKFSMDYLTEYVINYRTQKNRREVDFLAERLEIARGKYYSNQAKKAQYSDQFQANTIRLQAADVRRERIQAEYNTSSNFYNSLLTKYEEAKIKLHQETPVIKVLEPPTAPTRKSEPRRSVIVAISGLIGGFFGVLIALIRKKNYKQVFN